MTTAIALLALAAAVEGNLQNALDDYRASQQIPGVTAVVTLGEQTVFAGASGVANLETGRVMTPDTVFYAGSLSKIFTAVLSLQLVEEGRTSLDEVVLEVSGEALRLQHLLLHSSGLDREGDFDYWFNARFPDAAALGSYLAQTRLHFSPGTSYSYSSIGYAALGTVIERVSGMSYGEALSHYLTSKLKMTRTGTGKAPADISSGYSPINRVIPSDDRPFAGLGKKIGERRVREYHDAEAMTPAFGIFASARDLSHFTRALLGFDDGAAIPRPVRERLLSNQGNGRGYAMRLEKFHGNTVALHGGWFAAHRSYALLDLDSGIGIVVMANSDSASPDKIAEGLLDTVLAECAAQEPLANQLD